MNAVKRQIEEINRLKGAIEATKSAHLKADYERGIKRLTKELREYCSYRNYDFYKIMKGTI